MKIPPLGNRKLNLKHRKWVFSILSFIIRHTSPIKHQLCIYKPDAIGDFVLALPAIKIILLQSDFQHKILIVNETVTEFAKKQFPLAEVVSIANIPSNLPPGRILLKSLLAHWILIRQLACHTIVSLRFSPNEWQTVFLNSINAVTKFGGSIENYHLCTNTPSERIVPLYDQCFDIKTPIHQKANTRSADIHLFYQSFLESLLHEKISPDSLTPKLKPGLSQVSSFLIAPFGNNEIRDIPVDLLAVAVEFIQQQFSMPIHIFSSSQQAIRLQKLRTHLNTIGLEDLCYFSKLSLNEYVQKIGEATCILTAESATAHIATAMNKNTLILIGGGHYGFCGPWIRSEKQIWLTHRLPCFHCDWLCTRDSSECINKINSEEIQHHLQRLIENKYE